MTDLGMTIAPKSDQLNSDDLIAGPMTIKITRVTGNEGNPDQPVNIFFDGDNGKPYRPCKSMRRALVAVWGRDGQDYVGRSMTLYRDPEVTFGGMKVGGTRISHMSHIDKNVDLVLTATRASKKPFRVQPLKVADSEPQPEKIPFYSREHDKRFSSPINKALAQAEKEANDLLAANDREGLLALRDMNSDLWALEEAATLKAMIDASIASLEGEAA